MRLVGDSDFIMLWLCFVLLNGMGQGVLDVVLEDGAFAPVVVVCQYR
jgi:hypothetical protein